LVLSFWFSSPKSLRHLWRKRVDAGLERAVDVTGVVALGRGTGRKGCEVVVGLLGGGRADAVIGVLTCGFT
jgi:hypothetical protein